MVNSKKASSKSKPTPNVKIHKSTPNLETSTTPHLHEKDQILPETIKTNKDELFAHKVDTKEVINSIMKSANERLDNLSEKIAELTKSLEHTQDQLEFRHCSQIDLSKN